ncbi:unnamed protein product [Symbiodinium sp. CCMP2592]|nr:unnamed protein product [Symbiodinium sp. CCMP2592]
MESSAAADGADILNLDSLPPEVRTPLANYLIILETTLVSWGKEEGPTDVAKWKESGRLFVEHMGRTVQYISVDKITEHVKRRLEIQLTETQLARAAVKLSEICRHATSVWTFSAGVVLPEEGPVLLALQPASSRESRVLVFINPRRVLSPSPPVECPAFLHLREPRPLRRCAQAALLAESSSLGRPGAWGLLSLVKAAVLSECRVRSHQALRRSAFFASRDHLLKAPAFIMTSSRARALAADLVLDGCLTLVARLGLRVFPEASVEQAFKKMRVLTHPDKCSPEQKARAEEAFKELDNLKEDIGILSQHLINALRRGRRTPREEALFQELRDPTPEPTAAPPPAPKAAPEPAPKAAAAPPPKASPEPAPKAAAAPPPKAAPKAKRGPGRPRKTAPPAQAAPPAQEASSSAPSTGKRKAEDLLIVEEPVNNPIDRVSPKVIFARTPGNILASIEAFMKLRGARKVILATGYSLFETLGFFLVRRGGNGCVTTSWRESKLPGDILGRRFSGVDFDVEPPVVFCDVPHSHACTSAFAHCRLVKEICRQGIDGWVDVDVVNSVFSQFEANFKECPEAVKRYNKDRDGMVAAVREAYGCSRDVAKRLFIRLGFMGKLESWLQDFGLEKNDSPLEAELVSFGEDMRSFGEALAVEHAQWFELFKGKKYPLGSFMSAIYFKLERQFLDRMIAAVPVPATRRASLRRMPNVSSVRRESSTTEALGFFFKSISSFAALRISLLPHHSGCLCFQGMLRLKKSLLLAREKLPAPQVDQGLLRQGIQEGRSPQGNSGLDVRSQSVASTALLESAINPMAVNRFEYLAMLAGDAPVGDFRDEDKPRPLNGREEGRTSFVGALHAIPPFQSRAVAARGARARKLLHDGDAEVLATLRGPAVPHQLAEGRMARDRPSEVLAHVDGGELLQELNDGLGIQLNGLSEAALLAALNDLDPLLQVTIKAPQDPVKLAKEQFPEEEWDGPAAVSSLPFDAAELHRVLLVTRRCMGQGETEDHPRPNATDNTVDFGRVLAARLESDVLVPENDSVCLQFQPQKGRWEVHKVCEKLHGLYRRGNESFTPAALIVLTSNFQPRLTHDERQDTGSSTRVNVIAASSIFTENVHLATHQQSDSRLADDVLEGKLTACAFYWLSEFYHLLDLVEHTRNVAPRPDRIKQVSEMCFYGRPRNPAGSSGSRRSPTRMTSTRPRPSPRFTRAGQGSEEERQLMPNLTNAGFADKPRDATKRVCKRLVPGPDGRQILRMVIAPPPQPY